MSWRGKNRSAPSVGDTLVFCESFPYIELPANILPVFMDRLEMFISANCIRGVKAARPLERGSGPDHVQDGILMM
jgi:hypothetical protein